MRSSKQEETHFQSSSLHHRPAPESRLKKSIQAYLSKSEFYDTLRLVHVFAYEPLCFAWLEAWLVWGSTWGGERSAERDAHEVRLAHTLINRLPETHTRQEPTDAEYTLNQETPLRHTHTHTHTHTRTHTQRLNASEKMD